MTVSELIEELKKFLPEAIIINWNDGLCTTNVIVENFEDDPNQVIIW